MTTFKDWVDKDPDEAITVIGRIINLESSRLPSFPTDIELSDCSMDFFLELYERNGSEVFPTMFELVAWLSKRAKWRLLDKIKERDKRRQDHRNNLSEVVCEGLSPLDIADKEEVKKFVRQVISGLNDPYREAIQKVYYDGLKQREAAELMNVNEKTFSSWVRRAKEQLKEQLKIMGLAGKLLLIDLESKKLKRLIKH